MSEIQNFETHLDRMEREKQAQEATLRLEQERIKRAKLDQRFRNKDEFWIVSGLAVVLTFVLCLGYLIWLGVRGPNNDDIQRQQEIQMCYDHGGYWKPDKGDPRDDDFMAEHCVVPSTED